MKRQMAIHTVYSRNIPEKKNMLFVASILHIDSQFKKAESMASHLQIETKMLVQGLITVEASNRVVR